MVFEKIYSMIFRAYLQCLLPDLDTLSLRLSAMGTFPKFQLRCSSEYS